MRKGELDPFAVAAMEEIGIDIAKHKPMTFEELEDSRGSNFDLIVTLSPEAHHKRAGADAHRSRPTVEYWPTADPTATEGNREQRLDAYRAVRDQLAAADQAAVLPGSRPGTSRLAARSGCERPAIVR